jgi:hypothetical protein
MNEPGGRRLSSAEEDGDQTMKTLVLTVAVLLTATSLSLAQSQRNFGPNGPAGGDSFGAPYSGTAGARHAGHGYYRYSRHYWYR